MNQATRWWMYSSSYPLGWLSSEPRGYKPEPEPYNEASTRARKTRKIKNRISNKSRKVNRGK